MTIQKVAVIGSGVMGSGIAAQIANAGVPVVMLDIVPKDASDRSMLAKGAIEKMLKTDPAPFMHKRNAKLITAGNLEDDATLLGECDWIIEVVLEDLKIKHKTYSLINEHRKKGSIVSSNTSTIPLELLVKDQGDEFAKDFLITHFFNPPRYMRLLELVTGDKTRTDAIEDVRYFCDVKLGKGVVPCNDTPGFIANRLGVFWLTCGINQAVETGISVEAADAVMGRPAGIPKTGVFGLVDLVGIDLMPHLADSLLSTLPEGDAYRALYTDHKFIRDMIEAGYTGRKGKGGFYRLNKEGGKKEKQALSINADQFDESMYAAAGKVEMASAKAKSLKDLVTADDEGGRYAWEVLYRTLAYAAALVPEIADNIAAVDEAMRLGYNWKQGPFEMIDALGASWFAEKLAAEGMDVPELLSKVGDGSFYRVEGGKLQYFGVDGSYHDIQRPEGVMLLSDIRLAQQPYKSNESCNVWDIGDGVLCFEHTSKMNTFDENIFNMLLELADDIEGSDKFKALVIYNEGSAFSAGANLGMALELMKQGDWDTLKRFITAGQIAYMRLKLASFPMVAAPSGLALGGGCEILLHADHVQAHAESYVGLVEVGVGLIPAWGGCKEMILRYQAAQRAKHNDMWFSPANDPMGAVKQAFQTIGTAQVSKSAADAMALGYFRKSDQITMNRDRLLFDAKQAALKLAENYVAPEAANDIRLPGPSGKAGLDMAVADMAKAGKATPYDIVVSGHLAAVLSGGDNADWTRPVSEQDLLDLEVHEFMKLLHNQGTVDRIEHMLTKGKPLRN